jgi:2-hydroxychromene-2-carboxylate isomerase
VSDQPKFFYDLRDPECYLWAERVNTELPVVPEWVPVALAGEPAFRCAEERAAFEEDLARRAVAQGLQPLRMPARWPAETDLAPLGATYAKQIGRAVAFSLAAFRQAFAGGRGLDEDTILLAAAACEIHPRAMLQALARPSVAAALEAATAQAAAAGVRDVPAVLLDGRVFHGEVGLDEAAAALAAHAR